jgi:hypothetical protein
MSVINQISSSNTFSDWLVATQGLIEHANYFSSNVALVISTNTNVQIANTNVNIANSFVNNVSINVVSANTSAWTARNQAVNANANSWIARTGSETANTSAWAARNQAVTANTNAWVARTGSETANTNAWLAFQNATTASNNANTANTNAWAAVNGAIATERTAAVTLTNKTLTSPIINGGTISGITDLAVADGGTGASTAADARTNLGVGTSNVVQFNDIFTVRPSAPTTGAIFLGNTGSRYLFFDGSNYQMPASNLFVNGSQAVLNNGGTWGINISGNAATATSVPAYDNIFTPFFTGFGFIPTTGTLGPGFPLLASSNRTIWQNGFFPTQGSRGTFYSNLQTLSADQDAVAVVSSNTPSTITIANSWPNSKAFTIDVRIVVGNWSGLWLGRTGQTGTDDSWVIRVIVNENTHYTFNGAGGATQTLTTSPITVGAGATVTITLQGTISTGSNADILSIAQFQTRWIGFV